MKRSIKGQSMVEYAIGIGCVAALCMLVLGGIGHAGTDIVQQVLVSSHHAEDQAFDDRTPIREANANPWNIQ